MYYGSKLHVLQFLYYKLQQIYCALHCKVQILPVTYSTDIIIQHTSYSTYCTYIHTCSSTYIFSIQLNLTSVHLQYSTVLFICTDTLSQYCTTQYCAMISVFEYSNTRLQQYSTVQVYIHMYVLMCSNTHEYRYSSTIWVKHNESDDFNSYSRKTVLKFSWVR